MTPHKMTRPSTRHHRPSGQQPPHHKPPPRLLPPSLPLQPTDLRNHGPSVARGHSTTVSARGAKHQPQDSLNYLDDEEGQRNAMTRKTKNLGPLIKAKNRERKAASCYENPLDQAAAAQQISSILFPPVGHGFRNPGTSGSCRDSLQIPKLKGPPLPPVPSDQLWSHGTDNHMTNESQAIPRRKRSPESLSSSSLSPSVYKYNNNNNNNKASAFGESHLHAARLRKADKDTQIGYNKKRSLSPPLTAATVVGGTKERLSPTASSTTTIDLCASNSETDAEDSQSSSFTINKKQKLDNKETTTLKNDNHTPSSSTMTLSSNDVTTRARPLSKGSVEYVASSSPSMEKESTTTVDSSSRYRTENSSSSSMATRSSSTTNQNRSVTEGVAGSSQARVSNKKHSAQDDDLYPDDTLYQKYPIVTKTRFKVMENSDDDDDDDERLSMKNVNDGSQIRAAVLGISNDQSTQFPLSKTMKDKRSSFAETIDVDDTPRSKEIIDSPSSESPMSWIGQKVTQTFAKYKSAVFTKANNKPVVALNATTVKSNNANVKKKTNVQKRKKSTGITPGTAIAGYLEPRKSLVSTKAEKVKPFTLRDDHLSMNDRKKQAGNGPSRLGLPSTCSMSTRRSPRLHKQPETIELSDSEDETDDPSKRLPLEVEVVRIAFGKKVQHHACKVMIDLDYKMSLSFHQPPKRKTRTSSPANEGESRSFTFEIGDVQELQYFVFDDIGGENGEQGPAISNEDEEEEPMNFLALKIKPSISNKLTELPNQYDGGSGIDLKKRYITIEFRSDKDLNDLISHLQGTQWDPFVSNAPLKIETTEQYCMALVDDSTRDARQRKTSISSQPQIKDDFVKGKSVDDVLLVYPFPLDDLNEKTVVDGLNEAGFEFGKAVDSNDICSDEVSDKKSNRAHYLTVRVGDYERLEPGEWLNDTLVDFWMQWISRNDRTSVHFFSSHFYSALCKHGANGVESWTKNKSMDIFEKDLIFIPINMDLHWSLCVAVNVGSIVTHNAYDEAGYDEEVGSDDDRFPCLLFFDSLKAHKMAAVASRVRKWLNFEWTRLHSQKEDSGVELLPFTPTSLQVFSPKVPYQDNGWDCGVFVCRYAFAMYKIHKCGIKFTYRDSEILSELGFSSRKPTVFYSLITVGEAFQFDMSDIDRIRCEFKALLQRLSGIYVPWKQETVRQERDARREAKRKAAETIHDKCSDDNNHDTHHLLQTSIRSASNDNLRNQANIATRDEPDASLNGESASDHKRAQDVCSGLATRDEPDASLNGESASEHKRAHDECSGDIDAASVVAIARNDKRDISEENNVQQKENCVSQAKSHDGDFNVARASHPGATLLLLQSPATTEVDQIRCGIKKFSFLGGKIALNDQGYGAYKRNPVLERTTLFNDGSHGRDGRFQNDSDNEDTTDI